MKFFKYIVSAFAVTALFGAASCTDEMKYDPTPAYNGDEVYFSENESTDIDIAPQASSVNIYLNRVKADDELTVGLVSTAVDADDQSVAEIFGVPTQVTFPKGETQVPIQVSVLFSDITPGENYYINIKVDGEDSTPYGLSERTFTLSYSPWGDPAIFDKQNPATVTYSFPFVQAVTFDQILYTSKNIINDKLERYIVPTPAASVIPYNFTFDIDKSEVVKVGNDDCYRITTPHINTTLNDGEMILVDVFSWWRMYLEYKQPGDYTDAQIRAVMEKNGDTDSYYNTRTGIATVNLYAYPASKEPGYLYNDLKPFIYTVEFPGFVNYAFEYSEQGNFVDKTGAESVFIQVFKSENMAYFAAISKPGVLDEAGIKAAADELAADNDKEFYSESGAIVSVPVSEEGEYTLVTVGYDEGYNAVFTGSYTFTFSTVQAANDWEDFGEADYREAIISSVFDVPSVSYPVKVQRNKETQGLYRLVNPYQDWSDATNYYSFMAQGNYYLNLDCTNPNAVNITDSELGIGVMDDYGTFSVTSQANLIEAAGNATKEELIEAGYYGILDKGEIIFPAGTIIAAMSNYKGGAWAFYCNIDPENNTEEETGKFNPYWGEGLFYVGIYNLMDEAAGVKAKAPAKATGSLSKVGEPAQSFDIAPRKARKATKVNTKEVKFDNLFNAKHVNF